MFFENKVMSGDEYITLLKTMGNIDLKDRQWYFKETLVVAYCTRSHIPPSSLHYESTRQIKQGKDRVASRRGHKGEEVVQEDLKRLVIFGNTKIRKMQQTKYIIIIKSNANLESSNAHGPSWPRLFLGVWSVCHQPHRFQANKDAQRPCTENYTVHKHRYITT